MIYYPQKNEPPTRLRLFDYLDHHSNAHMVPHIKKMIPTRPFSSQLPPPPFSKYWVAPSPNPEPVFLTKKTPHLSVVPTSSRVSFRRRKVFQPFKPLKRNEKNWLGHRCQRMQRCCRDLSFNSCWASRQIFGHQGIQFSGGEITPVTSFRRTFAGLITLFITIVDIGDR